MGDVWAVTGKVTEKIGLYVLDPFKRQKASRIIFMLVR